MRSLIGSVVFLFVFALIAVAYAADPDLVELAKKEKARRAAAGTHKTFTNKDIEAYKAKNKEKNGKTADPSSETMEEPQTQTSTAEADEPPQEGQDPEFDYDKEKTYWRGRYTEIRDRIDKAQKEIDRLAPIVDQLKNTYIKSDDPKDVMRLQTEVEAKTSELENAKIDLDQANTAMEDLQEDGRKAGALPGWFRDQER